MNVTIIKGEQKSFAITLTNSDGTPFDLTPYDKYRVCIAIISGEVSISEVPLASGSVVALQGDPLLGTLSVLMEPAETNQLNEGSRQTIDVEVDIAASPAPRRSRSPPLIPRSGRTTAGPRRGR